MVLQKTKATLGVEKKWMRVVMINFKIGGIE